MYVLYRHSNDTQYNKRHYNNRNHILGNKPEKRDIQMGHIKERKGGEIKALLCSATHVMWAGADLPSVLHFSEYIMRW